MFCWVVRQDKGSLSRRCDGTWLLVDTQSQDISATMIRPMCRLSDWMICRGVFHSGNASMLYNGLMIEFIAKILCFFTAGIG